MATKMKLMRSASNGYYYAYFKRGKYISLQTKNLTIAEFLFENLVKESNKWHMKELKEVLAIQRNMIYVTHFFLCTGLGYSELASLSWPDITLDRDMIHINNGENIRMSIPITPEQWRLIKEEMGMKDRGPVFPFLQSADYVSKLSTDAARKAGGNKKPNSILHSYIERCVMTGSSYGTA
jgi:integrase